MSTGPSIGDQIGGRYELRDQLGSCASRVAFRAFDTKVEVEVALWYMRPEIFHCEASRARFVEAATRTRAVRHRHLLRVFEVGRLESSVENGASSMATLYLTQQLATSAELKRRLQAGGISDSQTLFRYAESLGEAIEAVHGLGMHHGWISPADVVEVAGQVKLSGAGLLASMDTDVALSRWGADMRYLAPEVASGGASSAASDWYSLAVILLELATGESAVSVERARAALWQRAPRQAEALSAALASDPARRPTCAQEFLSGIRSAWDAPNEVTVAERLATVIVGQAAGSEVSARKDDTEPLPAAGADVAARSFLEDDATLDEQSPALRLEGLSMKPKSLAGEKAAKQAAAPGGLVVKPVLRPLGSLNGAADLQQDLGRLAPPRPRGHASKSNYWLPVSLALVAGAAVVSLLSLLL